MIYIGWQSSAERPLTAEQGAGYALGIIGGCLMLLLLLYPLRKHLRLMRNWGPVKYWFRLHMLFGVLGWRDYAGKGEIVTDYFPSSGTGQCNVVFPVA